jgi:hypothetical protein
MTLIDHPYRPRLKGTLLGLAFFGGSAAMWTHAAIGNDRGLIIQGLIHLETAGATKFYWGMAAVSAVFVLGFLAMLASRLTSNARVTVTATELSAPRSAFARTSSVVRRADIQGLSVATVRKQRFLDVHHSGGKLTLLESCLPSDAAFNEVCEALRA